MLVKFAHPLRPSAHMLETTKKTAEQIFMKFNVTGNCNSSVSFHLLVDRTCLTMTSLEDLCVFLNVSC